MICLYQTELQKTIAYVLYIKYVLLGLEFSSLRIIKSFLAIRKNQFFNDENG